MVRVASIQMVSGSDWQVNLETALRLMIQAVTEEAKLLVLPEHFIVFSHNHYRDYAEDTVKHTQVRDELAAFARKHQVWICCGTQPQLSIDVTEKRDKLFSSAVLIDEMGCSVAEYHKMHLFDAIVGDKVGAYCESDTFTGGDSIEVVETPFGKVGLAVCYDLRFPELFRYMAQKGAQIFLVPSAFTEKTGQAHWHSLVRTRAIENLAYVVACNQGGQHDRKRKTYGHSCIVDPWGTFLGEARYGSAVIVADFDVKKVERLRSDFPVLQHCRLTISF